MGGTQWFGGFAEQAVANDSRELRSAIDDAIRTRLGHRRMFSTWLLLSPDGASLLARIPVGTDKRRASLIGDGWMVDRVPSGTRYYSRVFSITNDTPTEVVHVVEGAYKLRYGLRADGLTWALRVVPMHEGVVTHVQQ